MHERRLQFLLSFRHQSVFLLKKCDHFHDFEEAKSVYIIKSYKYSPHLDD